MKKYLLLLILAVLPLTGFAQEGLQKVRIDDFSGGQDSYNLSDVINPNQGVSVINCEISKRGQLSKRTGQALFANDLGNTAFTGVGAFYPTTSTKYMLAASGVNIIRSNDAGADWVSINGSDPLTGGTTEFIQANNLSFILNGVDYTSYYDGTTFTIGSSGSTKPPIASTGVWLLNYLFLAGDPAHPDWIYWSESLTPQTFDQATNVVKINSGDGQKIQRLEPLKYSEIIIYKERSIFSMNIAGDPTLGDWYYQPISMQFGCIAPRSVVNIGNDQWFLSSEPIAVRSLIRTTYDKLSIDMVSTPIQDIFDGTGDTIINSSNAYKSAAILFNNKYLIAIPSGSSTVNDLVCVYDFITKSWSLITGWYPAQWVVFDDNLYYIDANDGRVVQCFTGTVGDMEAGPVVSASVPTVGISMEYVSKNIDFDNPENFKQLDSLDMLFGATGSYTATVYIDINDTGYQPIGTVTLSNGSNALPLILPFTLVNNEVVRKTFQLQRYGEFKRIKVKVVQDGDSESCSLRGFTVFARPKPWRRE